MPDPEQQLLLASISLDQAIPGSIAQIVQGGIDWNRFFRLATQHGVLPSCCHRILTSSAGALPQDNVSRLEGFIQANVQNSLRLTWKLMQCLELLAQNAVQCIPIKGPILALQAYGDLNLRQFTDLDVLIHPTDFVRVYDLLVHEGYTPAFPLNDRQKKYLLWTDNHFSFERQGDPLEIHWEIGPGENIHPLTHEWMWQELSSLQIVDKPVSVLTLENTILFLCFHGAKHNWRQLKWLLDLALISKACAEETWLTILEHARGVGLLRQVSLGLLLAEDLVGAGLPDRAHTLINTDRQVQVLARSIKSHIFMAPRRPSLLGDYWFYLQTRERWQDRLHYLFDLIILPKKPDWLMISLPESLYFLYYLLRPIRGISLAIKAVFTQRKRQLPTSEVRLSPP